MKRLGQIMYRYTCRTPFLRNLPYRKHDLVLSLAKRERYLLLQQFRKASKCLACAEWRRSMQDPRHCVLFGGGDQFGIGTDVYYFQ